MLGFSDGGIIANSYFSGSVDADDDVGGLAGDVDPGSSITYSYSVGSVTGDLDEGALVGEIDFGFTCNTSIWNPTDSSPASVGDCGTQSTQANMKVETTYTALGWDFTSTWVIDATHGGYPHLQFEDVPRIMCGDGICDATESSGSCPGDCSPCPGQCDASCACPNTPPNADAGGPYVITLPTTNVNLDGSGSMDDEDCGVGVTPCPMLNYAWAIVNNPIDSDPNCSAVANGMQPSITCTSEGTADVTLTVTDSGGLQDVDSTTITVNVTPNTLPVADAGGPYVIALPSTVVDLDGSDSFDVEDCPGGGVGCPMVYDWVIVNDPLSAGCELSASGVQASITCSSEGSAVVTLTVTDSGGLQDVDSTTITVNAAQAALFQIVSFDLSEFFVSVEADDSVNVNAIVKIRNIGGDAGDAFVEIVVKDMDGVVMLAVPLTASSPDLAVGASDEHAFVVSVLGSWEPDIYTFYANVGDGSPPLHDQKLKTLTIALIQPAPVPELPLFLVPLAAFSVLAFLFFVQRKDFSKP